MRQHKLPAKIKPWSLVSVHWVDAVTQHGPQNSDQVLERLVPCDRKTSGYVLRYDGESIVVASHDDRQSGTDQDCEDVTMIPIEYVRRITRV